MMGVNGILFVIVVGTLLNIVTMNQEAVAIPTEDEIMAEIDKESEKINDIMNNKIENHPGMDLDGYCYNSAETLERCTNEIAKEWNLTMMKQGNVYGKTLTNYAMIDFLVLVNLLFSKIYQL